jgi:DNA modification methylase
MKAYYEDQFVTIYHGDCREILPSLPKVDLVLTDPPYGINRSGQPETFTKLSKHKRKSHHDFGWDSARLSADLFDMMRSISTTQIFWGGNYFADLLPPSMGWLYWDKGQDGLSMSDGELAWTSLQKALRAFRCNRFTLIGSQHPTQKPEPLMRWCLSLVPEAKTILDPFMGSGTTLRAAKDLGRKAIGIEIEERYCEIAARRCNEAQPSMYHSIEAKERQGLLIDA